jgi:hypothetical protein
MMVSKPLAAEVKVRCKGMIKKPTVVIITTMHFTCNVQARVTVLDTGNVSR